MREEEHTYIKGGSFTRPERPQEEPPAKLPPPPEQLARQLDLCLAVAVKTPAKTKQRKQKVLPPAQPVFGCTVEEAMAFLGSQKAPGRIESKTPGTTGADALESTTDQPGAKENTL